MFMEFNKLVSSTVNKNVLSDVAHAGQSELPTWRLAV